MSKVLHGEGKPRIVFTEAAVITKTVSSAVGLNKIILTGSPSLTDDVLNRECWSKNSGNEDTFGKIIAYDDTADSVTVDAWNNLVPDTGKTVSIKNKAADLPYAQLLDEYFIPDALPEIKLWNSGEIKINLLGFYYRGILDFSKYISVDHLKLIQDMYDSSKTSAFTFYPRRDNFNISYKCRIDPGEVFRIAQLAHHQGHRFVVLHLKGVERLTKIDLTTQRTIKRVTADGKYYIVTSDGDKRIVE